ncbi:transcriptional regulator, MarR family [Geodermatophilus amargosae]|uniref:Transcriptional regulator, MarR family n=1 Tax=Geodermatophilus amargosae TaxID=1296565 RepID=A0A1I7DBS3_9ACTN|nr:MarR family winged helix-turn-helix transcriptional regulator [Geodermatophilus amargosae]SFT87700.1 transcriptional regulator, MarR family [Geodermatophilus amargosae]SFU03198.1 transcriptional regulator, MarR family [Geodermatophilus amargosae]SFU09107.1 transcriptional regulator, MarR family [Geodermatophilus amargosae]
MGTVDEPRWLNAEEQDTWLAVLAMAVWLPDAIDAQLQRDAGVSHFEYQVMAMLSMSPERTRRMSEVAALANGSLTRLSRTVDRLEKRGWVTRRPDPDDGRATLAVLTDTGWEKVVATAPGHVAEVRRLVLDPLTRTQVRQLHEIATRIRQVVQPEGSFPTLPAPGTA